MKGRDVVLFMFGAAWVLAAWSMQLGVLGLRRWRRARANTSQRKFVPWNEQTMVCKLHSSCFEVAKVCMPNACAECMHKISQSVGFATKFGFSIRFEVKGDGR